MTSVMDKLEQTVERQMNLLDNLPAEPLRSECVAQVKAAVVAEAARLRVLTSASRTPRWLSVAAALLLAVGLSGVFKSQSARLGQPAGDVELLEMWAAAVDESSDTLAFLLEEGWVLNGTGTESDESELEDLLRSLEESFEQFEAM